MHYVYILESINFNKQYIGVTSNIDARLQAHNSGLQRWTKSYLPWRIIGSIQVEDKTTALKLEKKLKSYKNPAYIRKLILENKLNVFARARSSIG